MEKLKMHTPDRAEENYKKLAELFPDAVTETLDDEGNVVRAIDKDVLMQEINAKVVDDGQERYRFTWPDKRKAIMLANQPLAKTLRLSREKSVSRDGTLGGDIDSENIYIEGDNLDALKILQETYLGKVKMIYIDPPYNTGNNLIYKNDYSEKAEEYIINSEQVDQMGNRLVQNPVTDGRFHTNWLNMMYPRLRIAKTFLKKEDGILVCAIDENEVDSLLLILKEIFGLSYEYNLVTVVHNPRGQQGNNFSHTNEYAIFVNPKGKVIADRPIPESEVDWSQLRNWGSESRRSDAKNCFYPIYVQNGKIIGFGDVSKNDFHPAQQSIVVGDITEVYPIDQNGIERKWRYARQTVESIKDMLRTRKTSYGYEIEIGKTFGTQKTVWSDKRYDANTYGTKIINELVPHNGFTFPKSLWTVYDAILSGTKNDKAAIILDFFSGSGTTAHAVMEINKNDGGHRKSISIQIPELTYLGKKELIINDKEKNNINQDKYIIDKKTGYPEIEKDSVSRKNGFYTICQIAEKRIEQAGKKIKKETGIEIDYGFRCFKVDSSNMKDVYYKPSDIKQDEIDLFADNIKDDRTPEDLLIQVMLDLGVLLSSKIDQTEIAGKKVFSVADGYLIACFDQDVTEDVVIAIAKKHPFYAVFRDSSMANDSVAANFEQIFETYSPETVRKVL